MRVRLENFSKRFDDVSVIENMSLDVKSGEMMALLGPSGCGKSTTLFAVCGIYRFDGGRLLFGDRDVTTLPAQKRNVGVVFQSYALYPHMTVEENIAFPLRIQKRPRDEIRRMVEQISELVQIGTLMKRRPSQLSGGQQQRVALSRALIRRPDILLLDEPLANLDSRLRLDMRSEIRRLQQETGTTAILVTHDQVEAMSMCDRVAIMKEGKIQQIDTPKALYDRPANSFIAGFLGNPPICFLNGNVEEGRMRGCAGAVDMPVPERLSGLETGARIVLGVRPEFVQPHFDCPIRGRISFVETQGREDLFDMTLEDGSLLRSIQPVGSPVVAGDTVRWGIDVASVLVFSDDGNLL